MSLLITIFLLVFIAQLVTWVGKTVLLDIVSVNLSSPLQRKATWQIGWPRSIRPTILARCLTLADHFSCSAIISIYG
jgi:hypothetical protein